MKITIWNLLASMLLAAASLQTYAQGVIYDQESDTGPISPFKSGVDGLYIQEDSPIIQSFIPTFSVIDFVQLEFQDIPNNGTNGATVYVNLWTGSPNINSDTLVGSTTPVYMPNGFANDGLGVAGVTNFYFSTLIALTPGQTYYFQPVVSSGDNPWAVEILTYDAYPNGQLFVGGGAIQPTMDLWFREGIVSVPEPSTLALVGLSGFLMFTFKRCSKLVILLLFAVSVLPLYSAPDSVIQATAEAAGLTPASALPGTGTFWVMTVSPNGQLTEWPYPSLPATLSALPIYAVTNNIFIVDDTGGQISSLSTERMSSAQAAFTVQTQAQTVENLIELIQNLSTNDEIGETVHSDGLMIDTNGLWLEATNETPDLGLLLHNSVGGDNYQLLSTSNLFNTNWDLGQILFYPANGEAEFSPIPMTNAMTFYRVHQANPVMEIENGQNSVELNPTNTSNPGQAGFIYIYDEGSATNDVTVYYTIGGTAQNGIDYSNLTGVVVVPVSSYYAQINIDPIDDGLKPDQTVILTLLQNTNYLIDPTYYSATNMLYANPEVVPTAFGDVLTICPNAPYNIYLNANDPNKLPLTYSIQAHPTHGTLSGTPLNVTYTPTNCYEGQDSFTFTANDGTWTSAPATVNLIITDPVYAHSVFVQTCRGTPVEVALPGGDSCGETLSYALLSHPLDGSLSGTLPNLTYTPTGTNFTGTDGFNYIVYSGCGDSATNAVSITIGDANLYPTAQSVMTGTNQPVAITLSAADYYDSCTADADDYLYTVTSNPANGTLSGAGASLVYTPAPGFEGLDSFQFTASDGVWTSAPATFTVYVVAGPLLTTECDPFGIAVQLNWSLDTNVLAMVQEGLSIQNFIVSRATNSDGPFTAISTNTDTSQMSYLDINVVLGQTYYYVVNFESLDHTTGALPESPFSNEIEVSSQNPDDLIPANAFWGVVTNLSNPTNVVRLQAPLSDTYPGQYQNLYPLPNSYWTSTTTWSNSITMFIPTNTVLSQVQYAMAVDNNYWLYVNGTFIATADSNGYAFWSAFQSFPTNTLHYGTNTVDVLIQDLGVVNYFSMVVTTNTCGQ